MSNLSDAHRFRSLVRGRMLVAFRSIGWTVLTESDEDWEHTPEFRAFRPVTGT